MARRDDRDLRALLDDLDETLGALRAELDEGDPPRRRAERRPPRPPTVGELLRFTERHTIPTTIAVLEASVAALELLQGVLRLAAPDEREERALESASGAALDGVERTLSELRRTLGEADLPADPETRGVAREARELTEAVERRIEESRQADETRRDDRGRSEERERGVAIDVSEADAEPDVEAELRSLKDEVDDQDAT